MCVEQTNPVECDEVMEAVIRTVTMTGPRALPKVGQSASQHHR